MNADLINLVDCIEHLPVLPATTVRLVHLLGDKKTPITEVLKVIQYDQNLTLQILKLCNSAYFGLIRKFRILNEAVIYLGSRQLMQLIMGLHCNAILQQPQRGYGLLTGMLWRHSTAVAIISERLGLMRENDKDTPPLGLLFTAGLLHDIGKVILDQLLSNSYLQVLDRLSKGDTSFDQAEREVLGYDHMEVGEMVMAHWQLPASIADVGRYHHEPEKYPGEDPVIRKTIHLVHFADSIALSLGLGVGYDGLQYKANNELAESYGFSIDEINKLCANVLDEIQGLTELYQER